MTKAAAARLAKRLAEKFPGQSADATAEDYTRFFMGIDDEDQGRKLIELAVDNHIWLPKVPELRALSDRVVQRPRDSSALNSHIKTLARIRGYSEDEARQDILATMQQNLKDDPNGGWQDYITAIKGGLT